MNDGGTKIIILGFSIIGFFVFIIILSMMKRAKNSSKAIDIVKNHASGGALFSYEGYDTGIFLLKDLKSICLYRGANVKLFDIDKIRGHRTSSIDPDHYFTVGRTSINSSLKVMSENSRSKLKADLNSGLFIQTKDIDYPEWHIIMPNKNEQNKWHEILTQLYEGTLQASI